MKTLLFPFIIGLALPLTCAHGSQGSERKQLIMSEFTQLLELSDQGESKQTTPTPMPTQSLSQGELKVQQMLAENRARLKVREQQASKAVDPIRARREQYQAREQQRRSDYNQKAAKIKEQWQQKRERLLKEIPARRAQTFDLSHFLTPEKKTSALKSDHRGRLTAQTMEAAKESYLLLPKAFELEARDQGSMPTCAAFAAVRALELITPEESPRTYSEQFFYFASKPDCQRAPCARKGSWVTPGLDYLKRHPLPSRSDCPYELISKNDNQTQIPLAQSCFAGERLRFDYEQLTSLQQVESELESQRPVIVGVRLSPNFYTTEGLVLKSNQQIGAKLDAHAEGHALVIVGKFPLKESKWPGEGGHCFMVTNSWGEGWGIGGHACLSRSWLEEKLVARALVGMRRL